jgi:hypothetical protein
MSAMDRARAIQLLRIAASAVCLIVCALFVVLWVRSYYGKDLLNGRLPVGQGIMADSWQGRVTLVGIPISERTDFHWGLSVIPADTWLGILRYMSGEMSQDRDVFGFNLKMRAPLDWKVASPHWFLVLLFAAFGAAPWIRWSKRFSLRTLLIATTLIAVVLGLIVVFGT